MECRLRGMAVVRSKLDFWRSPDRYARRQARQRYEELVRENKWRIAAAAGGFWAAATSLHVWDVRPVGNDVVFGAVLVMPLWALSLILAGDTGAASWARGADAEDWTSAELDRHLASEWLTLDDVQLERSNIDHVAVGPAGVYVFETKYSAYDWASPDGAKKLEQAALQARHGARVVERALAAADLSVPVHAVVVLWGGRVRNWTPEMIARRIREEPACVPGQAISQWAATVVGQVYGPEAREAIYGVVRALDRDESRPVRAGRA